jgi:nitrate reductase NapE
MPDPRLDRSVNPPPALPADVAEPPSTRTEELRSFLFFTIVMAPVLAVVVVGGYGFLVWMYQLVAGPPAG